jgi:hypothetical protein
MGDVQVHLFRLAITKTANGDEIVQIESRRPVAGATNPRSHGYMFGASSGRIYA